MKTTIAKSVILFLSIPLINSIVFGFGTFFHDMYQSTITQGQFQEYQNSMILMISILIVSIPILEMLYHYAKTSNRTTILIYSLIMSIIAVLTFDQFAFRPFEHSLTFLSIVSLLFTRELLNKKLMPTRHIAYGG